MMFLPRRTAPLAGLLFLTGALLVAQDWKTTDALPGVDLKGLTASQKASVLKVLRDQSCPCGCGMKVAQCRIEDPSCSYSGGLAIIVADAIRAGKSEAAAIAEASASRWAHDQNTGRVLDSAISIPTAGSPVTGSGKAQVTLVEFSDFQCPYCVAAYPQIEALLRAYPDQVKLIFKQYPLEIHSEAYVAASAALAAHKQGKFWVMHNAMFEHHSDLRRPVLLALAKQNGLDVKRLEADMDSKEVRDAIAKDIRDGDAARVEGTPTIFIDGQRYNDRIDVALLKPLIEGELKKVPHARSAAAARIQ
ncbi:MAG TPA: thioredoxin domain-containing protein [Bryobacteraceae bacterium]|nr:thioredoxin domain-containing protein [Bryobacteraceae bacterium]